MITRFALCIACAGLLAACETGSQSSTAGSTAPRTAQSGGAGAGQLPAGAFPLSGARVISQTGQNTATVEVTRPRNFPGSSSEVRRAARAWCGRDATVSRIASSRTTMSSRSTYLVRCR